jgi:hypothetical protein
VPPQNLAFRVLLLKTNPLIQNSRTESSVQTAVLGFRVHSGWAAAVVLCGPADAPVVVDRRKLRLVKTFTYTYRQPYHTAKEMQCPDAIKFIRSVQSDAKRLAESSLRSLQAELGDFKIVRGALLLASGHALPEIEKILASHALIHTADGELFRDSLRAACEACDLPVEGIREKELFAAASSKALGIQPAALKRRIAAFGKALGPPWSQDEKFAALAAWLTLVR